MATEVGTAYVTLIPSAKGFAAKMQAELGGDIARMGSQGGDDYSKEFSGKASKGLKAGAGKVFGGLKTAGLLAGAAAGALIGKTLVDSIAASSDLSETLAKTGQIFGQKAMPQLEAFAGQAATALGQSKQQALDAAATFATFGKSAGLAGKDLVGFSTDFTTLASDLASFNNATPQEAIDAIGAALRGEAEPMRRFGVLLDDASMRNEALRLGLVKTTKEALTPQQKVLASQSLIFKQTKDAQGDFARTSGGLANQQRILTAQWENAKTTIGKGLLPVVTRLLTWANTMMPKLGELGSVVKTTVLPPLKDAGGFIAGDLVPAIKGIVDWMVRWQDVLLPIAGGIAAAVLAYKTYVAVSKTVKAVTLAWTKAQAALNIVMSLNPIGLVVAAIAALVVAFVIAYKKSETFRKIVHAALDGVRAAASRVAAFFTKDIPAAFGAVITWVRANWPKILAILTGPIGIAVLLIVKNWDRIKSVFSAGVAAVVGFVRSIPGRARAALASLGGVLRGVVSGAFSMASGAVSAGVSALVGAVKAIPGKLADLAGFFADAGRALIRGFLNGLSAAGGFVSDLVGNVWSAIKGFLNDQVLSRIDAAIAFKVDWPGPGSFAFNPDIPRLAHGGRATSASVVEIAEGGEPETAFPDSVLSGFLERMTAAATANLRGGGTYALTITNWDEGTGYIEEVAGGVVDDAADLAAQGRRAV